MNIDEIKNEIKNKILSTCKTTKMGGEGKRIGLNKEGFLGI